MECPSCGTQASPTAWICSKCDYILDPSVLGGDTGEETVSEVQEERTRIVAWTPHDESSAPIPEAVILGEVDVDADAFQVVRGADATGGKTATFLFYTSDSTTRIIHPDAVPYPTGEGAAVARTPYEDFILSQVDGRRSMRDIHKGSGLAPQEVAVSLLTLMDKGVVQIRPLGEAEEETEARAPSTPKAKPRTREKSRRRSRVRSSRPTARSTERLSSSVSSRASTPIADHPTEALIPPRPPPQPLDAQSEEVTQALLSSELKVADASNFQDSSDLEDIEDLPSVDEFVELLSDSDEDWEQTDHATVVPEEPPHEFDRLESDSEGSLVRRVGSLSGVWAEPDQPSSVDANLLIEAEADADSEDEFIGSGTEEIPSLSELNQPRGLSRSQRRPPPVPEPTGKHHARPVLDPAFLTPLEESGDRAGAQAVPPPSYSEPPPLSAPSYDDEAPMVVPVRRAARDESAVDQRSASKKRAALAAAVSRRPVQEKVRPNSIVKPTTSDDLPGLKAYDDAGSTKEIEIQVPKSGSSAPIEPEAPAPAPAPTSSPAARPTPVSKEPVDSFRMMKAQKLFDQALKDKAEGNLVSARMNMKLALTFDPTNALYAEAFDTLSKNPEAQAEGGIGPTGKSQARECYDLATDAENRGDVDAAIAHLEKAIEHSRQAPFFNRLGVILAMKKKEYARAQELIEQALEISPGNGAYEKNLHKILSMEAASDVKKQGSQSQKKGILGIFGRRK